MEILTVSELLAVNPETYWFRPAEQGLMAEWQQRAVDGMTAAQEAAKKYQIDGNLDYDGLGVLADAAFDNCDNDLHEAIVLIQSYVDVAS
jgi:hypothetical protein